MSHKLKKNFIRILLTAALFALLLLLEHTGRFEAWVLPQWALFALFALPYLLIGYDVILKAFKTIRGGQVFDEHFLMMIATFAAFAIGEYPEALAVMLFYQTGEWFQSYAVGKSRQSIKDLMEIAPEVANVIQEDGSFTEEDPEDVTVGAVILVKPGEKIPLDGEVIDGESFLDTAALTGESVPRKAVPGDAVISGCVNGEGTLRIRVTKEYEDSTVAKILDLVENASNKKAQTEQFITRFARYYTPVVTIGAVLLAVIPPLLAGGAWSEWIRRACVFLIVSCPCALVISVPLGFFGGIGAASRMGILVKGSNYLEAVARVKTVVFDKTGTLTKGNFRVTEIVPAATCTENELLTLAAHAEAYSNHPIAVSVRQAYGGDVDPTSCSEATEEAGHGVRALYKRKELLAGNEKLMRAYGVEINRNAASFGSDENTAPEYGAEHDAQDEDRLAASGTVVHVAYDGVYCGAIVIADEIKEETKAALAQMKRAGIIKTVMLTGDHKKVAEAVASEAGIDEVHAELLPGDKVTALETIMGTAEEGFAGNSERTSRTDKRDYIAFVGDGVNDAPVLMRADVGIAMGAMGSDAAIEAADIVLMDDRIAKIATVTDIARKTLTIVKQNIVFAIGVKLLILALGALGYASMWLAVFADVGVAVIAILNAMRMLRYNTSSVG